MSEVACVAVAGSTLKGSAEEFAVVLMGLEVVRWFQGGGEPVGYCELALEGGFLPLAVPLLSGSYFGVSALSFPGMPEWLGHHERVTLIKGFVVRKWVVDLQKEAG